MPPKTGKLRSIAGPIVTADGLASAGAGEVVCVGPDRIIGEVLKLDGDRATIQCYEYTGGLMPGALVECSGAPMSLTLGPGLLGGVFDGVQRPLRGLADRFGPRLEPGQNMQALAADRLWAWTPRVAVGDLVAPGQIIGSVPETPFIEHRIMAPPGVSGRVAAVHPAGDCTVETVVCTLEGGVELTMTQRWPVRRSRPFAERLPATELLLTGQRVLDTFFPIARGGTAAIPGDFGTGKTILQHQLARWSDSDVVIYVGCGERGNELTDILRTFPELEDPRTGRPLMERMVLIGNTSNMPVAAREVSIYTGITIAEYYRDMGYSVSLMADSTSRWAEALREAAARLEEMPAEEGYPAYLAARLAEFYERAGHVRTLSGREGSVTVVGAISPPSGDFSEPVTQHTTRFTQCFWALDQTLAYSRHYPAVNWLDSYSGHLEDLEPWWHKHNRRWRAQRESIMNLLVEDDRLQQIVQLVGADVLPDSQRLVLLMADLVKTALLQQHAMDEVDTFCNAEKQQRLLTAVVAFHDRAKAVIAAGAPLARLRELPVRRALVQARMIIHNGDTAALDALDAQLDGELGALEREYG